MESDHGDDDTFMTLMTRWQSLRILVLSNFLATDFVYLQKCAGVKNQSGVMLVPLHLFFNSFCKTRRPHTRAVGWRAVRAVRAVRA